MECILVQLSTESGDLEVAVPEAFFSYVAGDELKVALGPNGDRYFEFIRRSTGSRGVRIYLEESTGNVVAGAFFDALIFANSSILKFNECVKMVVNRYPFYGEDSEPQEWGLMAEEIERNVNSLDPPATDGVTFWNDFRADVSIGNYV